MNINTEIKTDRIFEMKAIFDQIPYKNIIQVAITIIVMIMKALTIFMVIIILIE